VDKEIIVLHPKHIVMATGNGRPNVPQWSGMKIFEGVIYHSDYHKDVEKWAGKKAVVIGAVSLAEL
jgi:cation diffusion facilitator CzcD-associated flavoprotein CzcO